MCSGIIHDHRVVCSGCASDNGWTGIPANADTHPDGFTCDHCGDTFLCE